MFIVGDVLKCVLSVMFLLDVLEFDGVCMCGLSLVYIKVFINGEEVFGVGVDCLFFVDCIFVELIECVEIICVLSVNCFVDVIVGMLNIVLCDGYSLDGGYFCVGGLCYDDGELKESFVGVYGIEFVGGCLLFGVNL